MPPELGVFLTLLKDQGLVLVALVVLYLLLHWDITRTRERFSGALREVVGNLQAVFRYQEIQLSALTRANLLKPEEQTELIKAIAGAHVGDLDRALKIAAGVVNPLTPGDLANLQHYTNMLRQGVPFTPEQAQDFHRLAHIVQEERSAEPATAVLLALAAFVLGVYLGSKK